MLQKVVSREILMDIEGSDALRSSSSDSKKRQEKRERGGTCLIKGLKYFDPVDHSSNVI